MVLADMANPPEHDFAPAWLKIPSSQQSSRQPHASYTGQGSRLGAASAEDKHRSRHYSTDSQHGFGRSPTHDQIGFRGRDERRNYSSSGARHHSVDELPWDPDPTTNWNHSQFGDGAGHSYGTGYARRGSSVPRNGQQYSGNGRFDGGGGGSGGGGYNNGRGGFHQGKASGRQRFNSGPKYSDEHPSDVVSKEEGQGEGGEETGKEGDNKSALSNQDFPSLSGSGDDVETLTTVKSSVPPGAWEKPPGTTKVISGRKLQLIKKSIPSSSDGKAAARPLAPGSAPLVDSSAGSKVGGQTGSAGQASKVVAGSGASSTIVLKSMTSVTPMGSSWSKEPGIRSAPMPASRISPVPKPSQVPGPVRSAPIPINPPPAPIAKTPVSKLPVTKAPSAKSPVSNSVINHSPPVKSNASASTTRPALSSSTRTAPILSAQQPPVTNKADASSVVPSSSSVNAKPMPVLVDSSKGGSALDKPASMTPAKPTAVGNMTAAPGRSGRPAPVFPRPAPVSSSRQPPLSAANRPPPVPVVLPANNSSQGGLQPIPVSSVASTLQPLTKGLPSPVPASVSPVVPSRSPTSSKPRKVDKLDFLNELRRSGNGELPRQVSQNNQENLRGLERSVWQRNDPTPRPKTILQTEHFINTNGIDIDNDRLTALEKGAEEESIPNFYPVFSPVGNGPDISSSLEAEKRLLHEMGWHEHSDNEEGYAPLTEDELKEFQKRSQQLKRNGFTRALPTARNSVGLPLSSIAQVSLEDGSTSSDSDSSSSDGES